MRKYTLVIRTGDAEIRALENTSTDLLENIFPLIEITRGRKKTVGKNTSDEVVSYPIEPRLNKIKKIFKNRVVGIAITLEELLFSSEISELYNSENGYAEWVSFLKNLKAEACFKEIVPVIVVNPNDDYYEYNLIKQVQALKEEFNSIIYRNTITDKFGYDDLDIIKEETQNIDLTIIIDCGYTPQASHKNFADKVIARIRNFEELLDNAGSIDFTVLATSFPNNVNDLGGGDYDEYLISSVSLYEQIKLEINVSYGDYGSINPKRNDGTVMARGWIPRIDVPLQKTVYYYRQRRPKGVTAYADTYKEVARSVISDPKFPLNLNNNWGIMQIVRCAEGHKPGATPSFWISVRMNIHIAQQIINLVG